MMEYCFETNFDRVISIASPRKETTHILLYSKQMGYAQISQKGHGVHLRQYSRAFIVDDNSKRVVFVSFDGAMIGHTVKRDVC